LAWPGDERARDAHFNQPKVASEEKQFSGLAEDVKQKLEKLLMRAGQSPKAEKLANFRHPPKSPGKLNAPI